MRRVKGRRGVKSVMRLLETSKSSRDVNTSIPLRLTMFRLFSFRDVTVDRAVVENSIVMVEASFE